MKYSVSSNKTVNQAVADLQEAVIDHGFGVLHIHNLKQTLDNKGVGFDHECQVLEVCNPHKAKEVLSNDMSINMLLPCRISVYEENGQTKIGMLRPKALLEQLSSSQQLTEVAQEVEEISIAIIEQAK